MNEKRMQDIIESLSEEQKTSSTFGERLREIRKDMGMTQDEFAKKLGTSKQILSRYELDQRTPKIDQVVKYARKLNVSVEHLVCGTEMNEVFFESLKGKPFYKIFIEVTYDLKKLMLDDLVRLTGLPDRELRSIITRRMKYAPLHIALKLTKATGVPLEVWAGDDTCEIPELSAWATEVARAYDKASLKDRNTARLALGLETVKE